MHTRSRTQSAAGKQDNRAMSGSIDTSTGDVTGFPLRSIREEKVYNYYEPFHGHDVGHLSIALASLRRRHERVVFFAGDSSLDNKYWFNDRAPALNGYEEFLEPQVMKKDVAYWLNHEMATHKLPVGCLNTAVEATSLNDRAFCHLLPQDKFVRDNIGGDDVLVVSIGGNDIALTPLLCTVLNISALVCCTPRPVLEHCACAAPPNLQVDCGCFGCGMPGCVSGIVGWPIGFGYVVDLFKNRVESYITRLLAKRKPKKVIVCMIYYPDEKATGSWADGALSCLCYNSDPGKLQCAIRKVFEWATARIRIPGTQVVPMPLFDVLDSKDTRDYTQRVEPSPIGGRKMAMAFASQLMK